MIEKFLDAMEEGSEYNFIACHYYEMSKFDLRTILLEYIYAISEDGKDKVQSELEANEVFGDD